MITKNPIPVEDIDLGFVQLVDYMGSDLTVCNAARVSFAKESEWSRDEEAVSRLEKSGSRYHSEDVLSLAEKDKKLIKYLATHNHWTPFAHPQITLRIKAPVSIRTQFFKHKAGFVENEISRRYVDFEPEFYKPKWRGKPVGGAKQGSDDFIEVKDEIQKTYDNMMVGCLRTYYDLMGDGVAPEQARFVLPQAMYTEWFWTGSLAAYMRFYKQRIEEHAQWEIRQYAKAIGDIMKALFPHSSQYLA